MFETVVEPVIVRLEANQYAGWFAVPRDHDFLRLRFAKIAGQIILDFGEENLLHSGLPNCASHDSASDLDTIAKISTVVPETS
jgi:hypothetical protein